VEDDTIDIATVITILTVLAYWRVFVGCEHGTEEFGLAGCNYM
jgi:hypothetical protein